jgi:hypothetical protein
MAGDSSSLLDGWDDLDLTLALGGDITGFGESDKTDRHGADRRARAPDPPLKERGRRHTKCRRPKSREETPQEGLAFTY